MIIAVVGQSGKISRKLERVAYEVGKEIAKRKAILVCGGRNEGIMDAVARGAYENNGITVGIMPESDKSRTSRFIKIPILTGMGFARNQIIALSCDAMIIVGGGIGTLTEVAYAYAFGKPLIYIEGTGGLIKNYVGKYMDNKKIVKIIKAGNAREAVELAFKLAKK